jgi:hypothetical protein
MTIMETSSLLKGGLRPLDELARAQAEVEAAEDDRWRLREELLGWVRPPWAPGAGLVADWFSDEDAAYDELPSS